MVLRLLLVYFLSLGKTQRQKSVVLARAWGRRSNRARRRRSDGCSTRIAPQLNIWNSWWTRDVTLEMLQVAFALIPFIMRNGRNVPVNTHRPCPSFSVKVIPISHDIYGPAPDPLVPHALIECGGWYESPCPLSFCVFSQGNSGSFSYM